MELMCPHCQQKLTIPDQYAGQLMRCPLCNGTFTAPALSAPPPPVFSMTPEPPPPPPSPVSIEPVQPSSLPPPLPETLPPPGEYTHSLKIVVSPRVIPWITPAGLLLVFLLSFMPWGYAIHSEDMVPVAVSLNAWNMGFSLNDAVFAMYLILAVLALVLAIPSSLFALGLAPTPPFVQALGPWRPVIAGGVALLSFLFLLIRYLQFLFHPAALTIWGKLSFRIHLVVIVAVLIEFWLELRRGKSLPPPRIEARW